VEHDITSGSAALVPGIRAVGRHVPFTSLTTECCQACRRELSVCAASENDKGQHQADAEQNDRLREQSPSAALPQTQVTGGANTPGKGQSATLSGLSADGIVMVSLTSTQHSAVPFLEGN
jgi:hypothetical protein